MDESWASAVPCLQPQSLSQHYPYPAERTTRTPDGGSKGCVCAMMMAMMRSAFVFHIMHSCCGAARSSFSDHSVILFHFFVGRA